MANFLGTAYALLCVLPSQRKGSAALPIRSTKKAAPEKERLVVVNKMMKRRHLRMLLSEIFIRLIVK